jgi:rsbT co-antagonist protein RsbR
MSDQKSDAPGRELAEQLAKLQTERDVLSAQARELQTAVVRAQERFDVFTATLPGISWESWDQPYEGMINYVSRSVLPITGYNVEEWQSRPGFCLEVMHPGDRERILRETDASYARGDLHGTQDYRLVTRRGEVLHVHVRYSILRTETGEPIAWQAFSLDVTAQRQAEAARDQAQEQMIRAQADLLSELSTPLIPILEDVVVMPLIGRIDQQRAERVIETLLYGVASRRARTAILDLTGVPSVDLNVARALVRAAQATQLLGVELVLTGIRAEVARALCSFDVKLDGIATLTTLQSGVAHVLRRRR